MISWYYQPKGKHAKKVKVATVTVSFRSAGRAMIKVALTSKGRKLLKHAKKLKITAQGKFTPAGQGPTSASKRFTLKR